MVRNILIAVLLSLTASYGDDRGASAPRPQSPAAQVAIFGDSIVWQLPVALEFAPFDKALNAGINGQTTGEIADRVTAAAPIVFLEGGTNDLWLNLPLDGIVPDYCRMLDKLAAKTELSAVVFVTIILVCSPPFFFFPLPVITQLISQPRYRVPVEPFLVLLTVYGFLEIRRNMHRNAVVRELTATLSKT